MSNLPDVIRIDSPKELEESLVRRIALKNFRDLGVVNPNLLTITRTVQPKGMIRYKVTRVV